MPTFRNTLFHLYLPVKMEQTECFETSVYKIWRLNFICRRLGTLFNLYLPVNMEQTQCFETSAYKIRRMNFICRRFGTLCFISTFL